jgi:gluconokinase
MIAIVMGVVGAGKTTIGKLLAAQMQWEFADADDFHSASNVAKIRSGIPLDDQDREPWLQSLHEAIMKWTSASRNVVLACSALKRAYRARLAAPGVRFVYLRGDAELIGGRIRSRHGHFAGEASLASQLADLEEPENAVTVSIAAPPDKIVAEIRKQLGLE